MVKYDYKKLVIIGEPYFDIDFSKVLYLTDTGRRWDGEKVSVRDKTVFRKPESGVSPEDYRNPGSNFRSPVSSLLSPGSILRHTFHSTFDIIKAAEDGKLPDKIMITVHS